MTSVLNTGQATTVIGVCRDGEDLSVPTVTWAGLDLTVNKVGDFYSSLQVVWGLTAFYFYPRMLIYHNLPDALLNYVVLN